MIMATKVLSTESFVEEKQKETELTMYAKLDDFEYINKCQTYIDIIQLQASLGANQNCRCRREFFYKDGIKLEEEPKYTYTVKANSRKSKTLSIKTEYNFVVDTDYFNWFTEIADTRQIKKRYSFKVKDYSFIIEKDDREHSITVPEIIFEIDIFQKENGYRSPWVKIDIELDNAFKYISQTYGEVDNIAFIVKLSKLPLKLEQGFIEKQATPEQKKRLEDLWKYEFKDNLGRKGHGS